MILNSFRRIRARRTIAIAQRRFNASTSCFKPSPEQVEVVKWLKTHNVVVSARPGAGKTATAEALAMENPQVPIAVITYSKRLELDTEKRLKQYPKVDTYTFHGLASHLFGRTIKDDIDLITERYSQCTPHIDKASLEYHFIVLDELQDLTDNLYWLASTFIASVYRATGRRPGILALGDSRQAIYDFKGADPRFLEKAETAFHHPFSVDDRDWKSLSLSHSFRLTRPTADFINNACLGGEQYILGTGDGPKPLYVRANLWESKKLFKFLRPYIEEYAPDKCAILAPSVRNNQCLVRLSNKLSSIGVPLSVSIFDDAPLTEEVIRGKLVVSTYHQFKGSERDLVIVVGADDSWFKYFGAETSHNRCPNPVFVALTRARKQLIIIQSAQELPMQFLDIPMLRSHTTFISLHDQQAASKASKKAPEKPIGVRDLTRHMRAEDLYSLVHQYMRIEKTVPATTSRLISPPIIVNTDPLNDFWEYVADLNGVAVTTAFKLLTVEEVLKNERTWAVHFAKKAAQDHAKTSGYIFRWLQLRKQQKNKFRWMVGHLGRAVQRIVGEVIQEGKIAMKDLQHEQGLPIPNLDKPELIHISGRADIVFNPRDGSRAIIWEIKLVRSLKFEHVAQVVLYGWLWAKAHPETPFPRLLLFNALDGERWEISTTKKEARAFVKGVIRAKRARAKLTDDEFRRQYEKTSAEAQAFVDRMSWSKKA